MFQSFKNLFKKKSVPPAYVPPPNVTMVSDEGNSECFPINYWRLANVQARFGFSAELIEEVYRQGSSQGYPPEGRILLGNSPVTGQVCYISHYDRSKP